MPQVLTASVRASQLFVVALFAHERQRKVVLAGVERRFDGVRELHAVRRERVEQHEGETRPLVVHHRLEERVLAVGHLLFGAERVEAPDGLLLVICVLVLLGRLQDDVDVDGGAAL